MTSEKLDLDKLQAVCDAAKRGGTFHEAYPIGKANHIFFEAALTATPKLIARIRELEVALKEALLVVGLADLERQKP